MYPISCCCCHMAWMSSLSQSGSNTLHGVTRAVFYRPKFLRPFDMTLISCCFKFYFEINSDFQKICQETKQRCSLTLYPDFPTVKSFSMPIIFSILLLLSGTHVCVYILFSEPFEIICRYNAPSPIDTLSCIS